MNKLIVRKCGKLLGRAEFFCELTDEMNKHLLEAWEKSVSENYHRGTYVCDLGERDDGVKGFVYEIRVPGATRGYFYTDENHIVTEVGFYEEQCYSGNISCYNRTLESIKGNFVGWRLEIKSQLYN